MSARAIPADRRVTLRRTDTTDTAPESGIQGVGRHSRPCRAGIVLKSGYGMLPQIGEAGLGRMR